MFGNVIEAKLYGSSMHLAAVTAELYLWKTRVEGTMLLVMGSHSYNNDYLLLLVPTTAATIR